MYYRERPISIGAAIFLVAIGAILAFAVGPNQLEGLNLTAIGWILMLIGLVLAMVALFMGSPAARGGGYRREIVEDTPVVRRRRPRRRRRTIVRDDDDFI